MPVDRTSGFEKESGPLHEPAVETLTRLLGRVVVPLYDVERSILVPTRPLRLENDAAHSFSLGIVACCLAPLVDPALEPGLIAQYALVHDLVEVYAGDTSVYADPVERTVKEKSERSALERLSRENQDGFPWLVERLSAYHAQIDPESRFVYAMDKLLPHAMVLLADRHPLRRTWEDYVASEQIARAKIANSYSGLSPLFEALCAEFVARPHLFEDPYPGGTSSR
jgi:5'-deoxynucleotidase YfbR-like HD superfamily hydrolase